MTSDYGSFSDAAELARVAMLAFVEMGNDTGTGKALVSRGLFLRRGGEYRDAIRCIQSALTKLPEEERLNQFVCHFELATANLELGRFNATDRFIGTAKVIAPAAGVIHLLWLGARLAARRQDYARAVRLYERTAVSIARSPVDTALVGVELARVYLQANRPIEAIETAKGLATLAMPWRANRLVSAAIRDLWCSARQGEMTIRILDRIAGRIQLARERRAVVLGPRPV